MYNFTFTEKVVHKMKEYGKPYVAKYNERKLNNTDFTIISNNCWGG